MATHSSTLVWRILMNRGPWRATVHGVTKNQTQLMTTHSTAQISEVKNPPAKQETQVRSLGREDPLEKEKATHSSILAWEIPCTEEPRGQQSLCGCKESDTTQRLNNNRRLLQEKFKKVLQAEENWYQVDSGMKNTENGNYLGKYKRV